MSKKFRHTAKVLSYVTVLLAPVWAVAASAQDIPVAKPPLELEAGQFVPGSLMTGQNHKVLPTVSNDGFVNSYTLSTEWGDVKAVSDYRLRVRIHETDALKALDDMGRAGVFGDSLVQGALSPVHGAVDLVTSPVDTVSGAVEGVGSWFGNIADGLTSNDPYQEGAVSAAVGWAQTKRAFAVELGVDPYTDWEPLQQALASVGRAAFAGGITAKVAMGAVTRDTAFQWPVLGLGLTNSMKKKLIDNPPGRLAEVNRAELRGLGISDAAIEPFLNNHHYSPMEKVQFVEALKHMKGSAGLEAMVINGARAPDKLVARYMQQQSEMIAAFQKQSPVSIFRTKHGPFMTTQDGRVVGLFPLDYVAWTARLVTIMQNLTAEVDARGQASAKELWFEGVVSPETRQGMESHGWTVKEKVQILIGAS